MKEGEGGRKSECTKNMCTMAQSRVPEVKADRAKYAGKIIETGTEVKAAIMGQTIKKTMAEKRDDAHQVTLLHTTDLRSSMVQEKTNKRGAA